MTWKHSPNNHSHRIKLHQYPSGFIRGANHKPRTDSQFTISVSFRKSKELNASKHSMLCNKPFPHTLTKAKLKFIPSIQFYPLSYARNRAAFWFVPHRQFLTFAPTTPSCSSHLDFQKKHEQFAAGKRAPSGWPRRQLQLLSGVAHPTSLPKPQPGNTTPRCLYREKYRSWDSHQSTRILPLNPKIQGQCWPVEPLQAVLPLEQRSAGSHQTTGSPGGISS